MEVYQVWFETAIGPTFSSRAKAEKYIIGDDYSTIEEAAYGGYPAIVTITIDEEDCDFMNR